MRVAILVGGMNGLVSKAGDTSSAYSEAETKKKLCLIADKGFGPLEGHTLVMVKAFHELRSSSA